MDDEVRQLQRRIEELERELAAERRRTEAKAAQLTRYAADLRETFKEERSRDQELKRSYKATVRALANAVETRDAYTGKHAERVTAYGIVIARELALDVEHHPEIEFGFLLHDVGKLAVPDAVLFKPGPLTPDERRIIEQHPAAGARIVEDIGFLGGARDVIRHHHEHYDGSGYPDGLSGDAIPLAARAFTVADVLDALTTDRPYREGASISRVRTHIEEGAGTHFDPDVVGAFMAIPDETFERIRAEIA